MALDGAADAVAFNTAWDNVGTGRKELAAGWHAFRVTGIDYGGGAGPQDKGWKTAKMAVGFHVGTTDSTAAADYTPFSSRHLRVPTRKECQPGAISASSSLGVFHDVFLKMHRPSR